MRACHVEPTAGHMGIKRTIHRISERFFWKGFMRMGIPKLLTTDQGSEFKNRVNDEMMVLLKINHRLTTAYHPQVQYIYVYPPT